MIRILYLFSILFFSSPFIINFLGFKKCIKITVFLFSLIHQKKPSVNIIKKGFYTEILLLTYLNFFHFFKNDYILSRILTIHMLNIFINFSEKEKFLINLTIFGSIDKENDVFSSKQMIFMNTHESYIHIFKVFNDFIFKYLDTYKMIINYYQIKSFLLPIYDKKN